jgi:hypothetical protein
MQNFKKIRKNKGVLHAVVKYLPACSLPFELLQKVIFSRFPHIYHISPVSKSNGSVSSAHACLFYIHSLSSFYLVYVL